MSHKTNGVNWNKSSKAKQRRVKVISRLENQLLGPAMLSESQGNRINKELEILKTRI